MNITPEAAPATSAPARRSSPSYSLVLYSGLATSALALLGVYLLDVSGSDFSIMGWYADYVLPIGALIVGVVASSGYGIASWVTGVKINRSLLWSVLAIQLLVYFAAQYIEFSHLKLIHKDGRPVGFFEYYDFIARSFAWKQDNGSMGQPLGAWGYCFRLLEIAGFAGGSLIVPAILLKAPYCQACQRYMGTRQLSLLAASVPARKIKKSDAEGLAAYQAEQEKAFTRGKDIAAMLQNMATAGEAAGFRQTLSELEAKKKEAAKLLLRISVHLISCKECQAGSLLFKLVAGQGNRIKMTEIGRSPVTADFVRGIR